MTCNMRGYIPWKILIILKCSVYNIIFVVKFTFLLRIKTNRWKLKIKYCKHVYKTAMYSLTIEHKNSSFRIQCPTFFWGEFKLKKKNCIPTAIILGFGFWFDIINCRTEIVFVKFLVYSIIILRGLNEAVVNVLYSVNTGV